MHNWQICAKCSPDFTTLSSLLTNGKEFFLVDHLTGRMAFFGTAGEAIERLQGSMYLN